MSNKRNIIKVVGKGLSILSIAFIGYSVWKMGLDFTFVTDKPLFVFIMIVGVIIKVLSLWTSGSAWVTWLKFFSNTKFEFKEARNVFVRANIGKYLPGNVMHFVQRNLFAAELGISQGQLALATVFEVMSYVLVALFISVTTARKGMQAVLLKFLGNRVSRVIVILALVIVVATIIVFLLKDRFRTVLKGYSLARLVKTVGIVASLQFVTLMMLGLVMAILICYAVGFDAKTVGVVISTYVVAWVLGFVVPGASGGMGIREMTLLLLLGPIMGNELVLPLSLVHRLITIIGDFIGYLITELPRKLKGVADNA